MAVEQIKAFQVDSAEIVLTTTLTAAINSLKVFEYIGGVEGLPAVGSTMYRLLCVRNISFPTNMAGSLSKSEIASTNSAVLSIQKNGTQFATITFDAAGTTGTFAGVATSFVVGDVLTVVAPTPQDATLSSIWFNLIGTVA